ncbi:MAG: sce7726 family protein [Bacteroidia bacterium]
MTSKNENINIEKLRSYSSVFSSVAFNRLLIADDFDFINLKIERYDIAKVGVTIFSYFDYLKYIYLELTKQHRTEYIYKNEFINEILLKKYGVKNTVAINEFRVGNSIADIALFNGTSKVFEIKTELDSKQRLNSQLLDYKKVFNEAFVITHESLVDKYLNNTDDIGIIIMKSISGGLKMEEIRKPQKNESIDSDTLIKLLRNSEYKNMIIKHFGALPNANNFTMFEECRKLFKEIPEHNLHSLFVGEMKARKTNTTNMNFFLLEIRQLCLSMHLNQLNYNKLIEKLNNKIIL